MRVRERRKVEDMAAGLHGIRGELVFRGVAGGAFELRLGVWIRSIEEDKEESSLSRLSSS